MFIYEFMAGLVDQIAGGEEDEEYDPHMHRKIEKPTSYMDTMIHLLKGSIGAGILAMPDAVSRLGLVISPVGVILIGGFATYCVHMLIAAQYELCRRHRRGYMAYPKSMATAVAAGPQCLRWSANCWPLFVNFTLVFWQLGLCCVYCVFVAENIKQVCDYHNHEWSIRFHLVTQLVPLILMSLMKDLKLLTPISTISNMVTIAGLLLVFFYLIEDDVVVEAEKLQIKRLQDIPIFTGLTLFALEAVGVILALEYNMEHPKHFVGLFGLLNVGMVVILAMYIMVGVFGYLKYGSDIQASLTLNLPRGEKKSQAAKIIFALAIFMSIPLQNFVAYQIVWRKTKKRIGDEMHCLIDYVLRVALVIIPWLMALAVPELGPIISLIGALCLSLLAIIMPALMDLCLWYPDQYGCCRFRLVRDVLIVILGLLCLVSGVYTSMLEIIVALAGGETKSADYDLDDLIEYKE